MAEITLRGLRHSYFRNPACDDDYQLQEINITWHEGMAYAVLGPSGSGKTTLLDILSGLLTPTAGQILFDGRDVTRLEARDRNIAQVFQFPVVYDTMSVFDNLAFPLRTRRMNRAYIHQRVEFIAGELGLNDLLGRRAQGLTAGEKQRISLGRGLVREDVSAILLDEPLTVIDPVEKLSLRRVLKRVQTELGVQLIYVTHDQHEALSLADSVIVMDQGAVVQAGTPRELFETPDHAFVGFFIGSPGMNFIDLGQDTIVSIGGLEFPRPDIAGMLQLGVRPEFLFPVEQGKPGISGTVERVENFGDEQILSVAGNNFRIKARLQGTNIYRLGEPITLGFQADRTFLYADRKRVSSGDMPWEAIR